MSICCRLNELNDKLNSDQKTAAMSTKEPEVGQLCVAKFPIDDRLVMNDSVLATSLEGKFRRKLTYSMYVSSL